MHNFYYGDNKTADNIRIVIEYKEDQANGTPKDWMKYWMCKMFQTNISIYSMAFLTKSTYDFSVWVDAFYGRIGLRSIDRPEWWWPFIY